MKIISKEIPKIAKTEAKDAFQSKNADNPLQNMMLKNKIKDDKILQENDEKPQKIDLSKLFGAKTPENAQK